MTSRPWSLLVVFAFVLALLPRPASSATTSIALPTWPQKFNLRSGQTVRFGFPMDKAGSIVVDLQWTGAPITVALTDPTGKTLQAGAQHSPPKARIVFKFTPDSTKPPVYAIAISAPPAKAGLIPLKTSAFAVTGQISIASPFDPAVIQTKLQTLVVARRPTTEGVRAALPKPQPFSVRLAAYDKGRLDAIATETAALRAQMNTRLATRTAALRTSMTGVTSAGSGLAGLHGAKWAAQLSTLATGGVATASPSIVSVTPATGMPGDEVVLTVSGITADTAANHVLFTLSTNTTVEAPIYAAVVNGANVNLTVAVPCAQFPANPNASIAVKNSAPATTPPAKFGFTPIPTPAITAVRLVDGIACPGHSILIDGSGFTTGSKVFFTKIPGSSGPVPAAASSAATPSPTLLPAGIPNYTLDSQGVAGVYVTFHYKHKYLEGDFQGAEFPFVLDASSATFATINAASAPPGHALLLSGSGFTSTQGEVHCVIVPGQDLTAPIDSWSDTQILIHIPDYQGIPASVTGTIYVKRHDGTKTNSLSFVFAPPMVHQLIDLSRYLTAATGLAALQWSFHCGSNKDSWKLSPDNTTIQVHHEVGFFSESSGTDFAFWAADVPPLAALLGITPTTCPTWNLKNGWTVSAVTWWQDQPNEHHEVYLGFWEFITVRTVTPYSHAGATPPSANPGFHADWDLFTTESGSQQINYSFNIEIYGPKGCDYF